MASSFSGSSANMKIGEHRVLHCALSATTASITGATAADPVAITATSHGFSDGDRVRITSVGGMTEINNRDFLISVSDANTFTLVGEDGSGHTSYTSGGTATLYTSTDLGITEGGSEITIERSYRDRTGDQDGVTPLDRVNTGERVTARVTFKELTAANLAKLDPMGTLTGTRYEMGGSLAGSVKAYDNAFLLVFHPMDAADTDNAAEHAILKAVPEGPIAIPQPKNDDQTVQVTFIGLPDRDRTRGLRTYRFGA